MYRKTKPLNGKRAFKRAQSTLEITVALVAVFIFLLGTVKIFVWVNEQMVLRQRDYENDPVYGRVAAGGASGEVQLREFNQPYPELDIFSGD